MTAAVSSCSSARSCRRLSDAVRAERERWFGTAPWTIDMYPEYGDPLPLWPDMPLPISEELRAELQLWNGYYERLYDWDTGWKTAADAADFWRRGHDLLDRVRQELGPDFIVTLHDEFDR